ncbi:hypothetical protein ACQKP0_16955 [Heyndrickxia sp. NPDC080065]|uniref:hypothetical protein n=1 Tax=Heyndrickxia sp. NPDC080065 TaxID=3390568 RepID=UPI003D018CA7
MNSERKETIIKEILYWKEHKMLPDHYCDYLLALYSEGELKKDLSKRKKGFNKLAVFLFLISLSFVVSLFVIYFTEIDFILQTMILTSFVVLFLILGFYYSKKEFWYSIFYIGAALILLLLSVHLNRKLFNQNTLTLYITLFLNCFIWLITGWKLKLVFFIVSGIIGIITLIIYILIY